MTTHVFIVDPITFKLHLEYLFAGTGAKDNIVDFNNRSDSKLNSIRENMLVSMISDSSRIRKNDLVIFYLQQSFSNKIFDGKFYGIFKAKDNWSFLDNNSKNQYLKKDLKKSLTFRTLIEPYKVYEDGVTEWEALDEIKNMTSPNQMLWSLIYRKLKGNRGNTMITIYESERLCQLIRNKSNRTELDYNNKLLSFDLDNQKIVSLDKLLNKYSGKTEELNILTRLVGKFKENKSFESHLQAYIVKILGTSIDKNLDKIILDGGNMEWLGNEVSCGVGMQRIDIMPSVIKNSQRIVLPIELKSIEASEKNIIQIQRYIDWIQQYYIPNRQSDIQPILISKKIINKGTPNYNIIVDSFKKFNQVNNKRCNSLKFIEFSIKDDSLFFEEINY